MAVRGETPPKKNTFNMHTFICHMCEQPLLMYKPINSSGLKFQRSKQYFSLHFLYVYLIKNLNNMHYRLMQYFDLNKYANLWHRTAKSHSAHIHTGTYTSIEQASFTSSSIATQPVYHSSASQLRLAMLCLHMCINSHMQNHASMCTWVSQSFSEV